MYTMVSSFFVEGKFSWLFQMLIQVIDDVVLLRTRISTLCTKDTFIYDKSTGYDVLSTT